MWMVRSDGGRRYDDFRDRGVAGIGFPEIAPKAKPGVDKKLLVEAYVNAQPGINVQSAMSGVSQVLRFVNEIQLQDWVITYSPANRTYLVGRFTGTVDHRPDWTNEGMNLSRSVEWLPDEIRRDDLTITTRNTLGSVLTVFKLSEQAQSELVALANGEAPTAPGPGIDEPIVDPLAEYESVALERIKDTISRLDPYAMQDLVAGTLRAMGYRTQVSPPGSDLGRDILASKDGFGFERPRIIVEVKHRKDAIGSQGIRSLTGGRHPEDRCLFVSTGGFTREARYEADRSNVPVVLWTLDDLTKALMDHYESTDTRTKALVSLRNFYIPAD